MIRGTTPTHIFQLPMDTGDLKQIRITYSQLGRTVVEKTERDVRMEGSTITLTLTQEETLAFYHKSGVRFQIKVLTRDGTLLASAVKELSVGEILNTEVLE